MWDVSSVNKRLETLEIYLRGSKEIQIQFVSFLPKRVKEAKSIWVVRYPLLGVRSIRHTTSL